MNQNASVFGIPQRAESPLFLVKQQLKIEIRVKIKSKSEFWVVSYGKRNEEIRWGLTHECPVALHASSTDHGNTAFDTFISS